MDELGKFTVVANLISFNPDSVTNNVEIYS